MSVSCQPFQNFFLDDAVLEADAEPEQVRGSFNDAALGCQAPGLLPLEQVGARRPGGHLVRARPVPRSRACKLQAGPGFVERVKCRFEDSAAERRDVIASV